jgi:hypothetical protein
VAIREYRERVIAAVMQPVSNTPEEMLQVAKLDAARIENIVRTANIKLEL